MITETKGRIFHIHVQAKTEDGVEDIVANVAMEPSMGLLLISAGEAAAVGSWPDRTRWGTKTFEEFLCSRTPSWVVGKILGRDAMVFDGDRTRAALIEVCGDKHIHLIDKLLAHVDSYGEILDAGKEYSDELDEILEEPVDGFIFMETTGFADFMINGVLPALFNRIKPPPLVTNQTNLKLC
jgi:hypothetical protein